MVRPDLMTVAQVAAYLQLNKLTVHRYIREGRLTASKIGKAYRVRKADVDAFLESHKVQPPAARPRRTAPEARPAAALQPVLAGPVEEIRVAVRRSRAPEDRSVRLDVGPLEWVTRWLH